MSLLNELLDTIDGIAPDQRQELIDMVNQETGDMPWLPQEGPQMDAYLSLADEVFYGGSAGGGKTDLGCGLALTAHKKSLILRRISTDAKDISDRIESILGSTDGRNLTSPITWKIKTNNDNRVVHLSGCKTEDDKQRFKGRPYDLYVFDEIPDFTESQFRFIKTWNRSAIEGQRCRVLCTGNPPTSPEGMWVIRYWAAWLDPKYPNPAKPGEIRWFVTDKHDSDIEVDGPGTHTLEHEDGTTETLEARSRTFIRAKLSDNKYLSNTDYGATLDQLPQELRRAYRDGQFDMNLEDDPYQVIPTEWILAAQERWKANPKIPTNIPMCSIGVDVAQGGKDDTVLAPRYDGWFAPLIREKGKKTREGKDVAAMVIKERHSGALPIIDMGGGYGGSCFEILQDNGIECKAWKGAELSTAKTRDGRIGFANKRAQGIWQLREALDPQQQGGSPIFLPDEREIVADLSAFRFRMKRQNNMMVIEVESKDDMKKRLGRSPDAGDAIIMAWQYGDKSVSCGRIWRKQVSRPKVVMGHNSKRRRK